MAVTFEIGDVDPYSGLKTQATVMDNAKLMVTQRGKVRADELVQGDLVCCVSGCPLAPITSDPVVT